MAEFIGARGAYGLSGEDDGGEAAAAGGGAAGGEEEPERTEVEKLAVSRCYVLSEDWSVGITHLVLPPFLVIYHSGQID